MAATVTLELCEFQANSNRLAQLEADLAKVIKERDAAILSAGGNNGFGASILSIFREHSIPVICYAIAQLHPETTKNWPHEHLDKIAEFLRTSPIASQTDIELADSFSQFSTECKALAMARRFGVEKLVGGVPISGGNYEAAIMGLVQQKIAQMATVSPMPDVGTATEKPERKD